MGTGVILSFSTGEARFSLMQAGGREVIAEASMLITVFDEVEHRRPFGEVDDFAVCLGR